MPLRVNGTSMALLMGTDGGIYRVEATPFEPDDVRRVLDCGVAHSIRSFDQAEGVYAATDDGLFRSTDDGRSWNDVGPPVDESEVWSVLATGDGTLFAGTNDPKLFRSTTGGDVWTELRGFRELPSSGIWQSPVDPQRARLRVLESPPEWPDRLVAGVESGGFHVSDDGGETWTDRRERGPDDFHQVLALDRDVYVAATGHLDVDLEHLEFGHAFGLGGLHRTKDAGRSWTRLDPDNDYTYTRSLFVHGETLFFAGATAPPPEWHRDGADAGLFEAASLGRTYERVEYPGLPHEIVEAFATLDGQVICGTAAYSPPERRAEDGGRVIRRLGAGAYETVGRVPDRIRCLVAP